MQPSDSSDRVGVLAVRADGGACRKHPSRTVLPGLRMCDLCKATNDRRRAKKHAWEMAHNRAQGVRPIEEMRADQERERKQRVAMLRTIAEERGALPTCKEIAEMFSLTPTSGSVVALRRQAREAVPA